MCKVRRNVTLSKELDEELRREAEKIGLPVPSLITFIVSQYIQQRNTVTAMADMKDALDSVTKVENPIT